MAAGLSHAFIASSLMLHLPSLSAEADFDWPAKKTDTFSPGWAVPYTATGMSRCRTMCSVKMPFRATSACADVVMTNKAAMIEKVFMRVLVCCGR